MVSLYELSDSICVFFILLKKELGVLCFVYRLCKISSFVVKKPSRDSDMQINVVETGNGHDDGNNQIYHLILTPI